MKNLMLIITLVFAVSYSAFGDVIQYYVSPNGNDGNNGTLASPFKSLARARDQVRQAKQLGAYNGAIVYLRGGRHYIQNTIQFNETDSGNANFSITYKNYPGETPVLVGGVPVTGWQLWQDGIYRAICPEAATIPKSKEQLIENDFPLMLARTPNDGWLRLNNPTYSPFWSWEYRKTEFNPAGMDISQLQIHLMHHGTWFSGNFDVGSVDSVNRRIHLMPTADIPPSSFYEPVDGQSYVIRNALGLLDYPGEFFVDRSGYVYLKPRSTNTPGLVELPTVQNILLFKGSSSSQQVSNITIEGLTFSGTLSAPNGWGSLNEGQIHFNFANNIAIRKCRLLNAGATAIDINEYSSYITIENCEISRAGYHGISLHCWAVGGPPAFISVHNNTIFNNYIHHIGRLTASGCGIILWRGGNNNTIENNLITDTPKEGILMFSDWDVPRNYAIMNNNTLRFNELARMVTGTSDGGAFYIGATTDHTLFENNRIQDCWSFFLETYWAPHAVVEDIASIDFDPGSAGCFDTQIRNNVAYGENAWVIETGGPDEMFLTNNYFENPDRPGKVLANGVWINALSFNPSLVNPNVGLTSAYPHPYPAEIRRPISFPVAIGFEGNISPFYMYHYSDNEMKDYLSKAIVRNGVGALRVDKDVCVVRYRHPASISKKVSIWFYDDAALTKAYSMIALKGVETVESVAAIGVDCSISVNRYVIRTGHGASQSVNMKRSTGWHKLTLDVKSSGGCTFLIDDRVVGSSASFTSFRTIDIGDPIFNSHNTGLYYDELTLE